MEWRLSPSTLLVSATTAPVSSAKPRLQKHPSTVVDPTEDVKTHLSKKILLTKNELGNKRNLLGDPIVKLSILPPSKNATNRAPSVAAKTGPFNK